MIILDALAIALVIVEVLFRPWPHEADSTCTCRRHAWDPCCPRHGRSGA